MELYYLTAMCTAAVIEEKPMAEEIIYDLSKYNYTVNPYSHPAGRLIVTKKVQLPLKGKTVIFTGVLSKYERAEAVLLASEMGAKILTDVKYSPKIDMVILGLNPGIKNQKLSYSMKTGAELVTDKQFTDMVTKFKKG